MEQNQTVQAAAKPKNIGYRILMALMALCVPIVTYFNDLIYMVWDSEVFKLLAQLQGNNNDNGQTEQAISLRYLVEELLPNFQNAEQQTSQTLLTSLAPIKAPLIAFGTFLALAVVCALVVFFVSCFCRNRVVGTSVAGGGLVCIIGMAISFHYIAAPLLAGEISLGSLVSNALLSTVLSTVAKLSIFQLSTGFYLLLFLFIAMVLWGLANWLVSLGEKTKA